MTSFYIIPIIDLFIDALNAFLLTVISAGFIFIKIYLPASVYQMDIYTTKLWLK